MTDEKYQVGSIVPLRQDGEQIGTLRIISKCQDEAGERQVEAEIDSLAASYDGSFKVGTMLRFPEDGYIGTFQTSK